MNQMEIFKNPEFGSIRTFEQDGKVLFCGKDIAKALGYQRTADAITAHCKGVCVLPTPSNGGIQRMKFIPEGDVYRLIVHSKLPSAERFERWVFDEVLDLLVGLFCGAGLRLAVYLKSKNAKKYRHGMEYGSARWGTHEDIAPYVDPVFQNNVILTKTESLTMNSRPKDPKTARNKNVLVIGGSGSGKTRFWLKPNLMQMHSSYVVTDPKGTILVECGKMLQRGTPKMRPKIRLPEMTAS